MGFILFLILACGLPGLMLFVIRQRVPEEAWAGFPMRPPKPAAPVERGEARTGYSGDAAAGGAPGRRLDDVTARQGTDIEHGLASNTVRVEGSDRRLDGTVPPGRERDGGSQAG